MATKGYTGSIYTASFSKNDMKAELAADLFSFFFKDGNPIDIPVWKSNGYAYELVVQKAGVGCYKGKIKRFGRDPLPTSCRET